MPRPYEATTKTIGELLGLEHRHLVVPLYQRSYSWKGAEVSEFWNDLVDFAKDARPQKVEDQYFLGSVVLVERDAEFEILDGQQRLATTTILLAVIRDLLREGAADDKKQAELLQQYIASPQFGGQTIYRLVLNKQDRDYFRAKIQDLDGKDVKLPRKRPASLGLIQGAHNLLRKQAIAYRDEASKDGAEHLKRLAVVVLQNVSLVACTSTDYDTAAGVFITLNTRGIELSTADLLRTWLMGQAGNDSDRADIAADWDVIYSIGSDVAVDDFLRHFWISHHGDVKKQRLYKTVTQWVIKQKEEPAEFSRELAASSQTYVDLATAQTKDDRLRPGLAAVRSLGAKALRPALLSLWENSEDKQRADRERLLSALVTLYVRFITIGSRDNSELEQVVFGIAQDLRKKPLNVDLAIQKIHGLVPDDDRFKSDFADASAKGKPAAYLLRELEHARRPTKELKVATPDLVHVEHIYPQAGVEGERWDDHEAQIDRIGNLTPLAAPINSSIQDKGFQVKKEEYKKSDLQITRDLTRFQSWDASRITSRQKKLAKIAVEAWPYPS
jgi:hypothetical protein